MIITIIYMIFSFLMDGLISNYINTNILNPSYSLTIYSLIALIITYNYFENDKKYLYLLIVMGILFDIVYTNTLFLNVFLFLIIYLVTKKINYYIPNNLLTINIKSLIAVLLYHLITFILLVMANYYQYPFKLLGIIISRSIIMTIIYTSISYLILKKVFFKHYDKKIK